MKRKIEITGDLGLRLQKALLGLLSAQPYSDDYLLATVAYQPGAFAHYPEYSGDVPGRWILALTMLEKLCGHQPRLHRVLPQLLRHQREGGFFGRPEQELDVTNRAQIYGNAWMLQGLVAYHEHTGDPAARETALRLGEYYLRTAPNWLNPEERGKIVTYGYAYGCYTHALEGIVGLYRISGDPRYLQLAKAMADAAESYDKAVHSHMHLSTLRGMLALYEADGVRQYLELAIAETEKVAAKNMLPGGGVYECYGIQYIDEACSTADFLMLNLRLWQLTRERKYHRRSELIYRNYLPYSQLDGGLFGSLPVNDEFLDKNGEPAYWCCAMWGASALTLLPSAAVYQEGDDHVVDFLVAGEFGQVKVRTDFPYGDQVKISVTPEVHHLRLNMPLNCSGVEIKGRILSGDCVELPLEPGGTLEFRVVRETVFECKSIVKAPGGEYSLLHDTNFFFGPLLMAQSKPMLKRRGHFLVMAERTEGGVEFFDLAAQEPYAMRFNYPAETRINYLRLTGHPILENLRDSKDIYFTSVTPLALCDRNRYKVTFDAVLLSKELRAEFMGGEA